MNRVQAPRLEGPAAPKTPEELYVALLTAHEARRQATDTLLVRRMASPR